MLNKKAQISNTMTWIIATIVVIVMLMIFIYTSSLLAKTTKINYEESKKQVDWIKSKTSLAYLIKEDNKATIDEWIKKENEK
ncbi:MAG: hypothetical protein KJ646_01945 [Nanoarchaeota archaeon]|nr:hypothetical protein [Nanoarchaeota archaeon]MBU4116846.1 hypothetical protein [Nanoarchaeota archaeon]